MANPFMGIERPETIINPYIDRFRDPLHTNALAAEVSVKMRQGDTDAYFVPAVQFIIDASLGVVTEQHRRGVLPDQISARSKQAIRIVSQLARGSTESGLFINAYQRSPHLRRWLPENSEHLADAEYMSSLGTATIDDTCRIVGGAFRVLQDRDLESHALPIITDSPALLVFGSVGKRQSKSVAMFLGTPYAQRRHYRIDADNDRVRVDLSPGCMRYILARRDELRGCPARKLKSGDGEKDSVMRQGLNNIAAFLLADGAVL